MLSVFIVDDEEDIVCELEQILGCIKDINISGSFTDPQKALNKALDLKPDLCFLDISMPVLNGFELAHKLIDINPQIEIVFITAYNNYAAEAFEINALDYILKPFREERVHKAVNRIREKTANIPSPTPPGQTLDIYCFKKLEVFNGNEPIRWKSRKSAELFAYLLDNNGQMIRKDRIIEDIWPEYKPQKALVNLQTGIYRIKKSLACFGKKISITFFNDSYKMDCRFDYYDVDFFLGKTANCRIVENSAISKSDIDKLAEAVNIYIGHYLEEDGYTWAAAGQEYLKRKYAAVLEALSDYFIKNNEYHNAAEYLELLADTTALNLKAYENLFKVYSRLDEKYKMHVCYERLLEEAAFVYEDNIPDSISDELKKLNPGL